MEVLLQLLSQALQTPSTVSCLGRSSLVMLSGPWPPTWPPRVSIAPPCMGCTQGPWGSDSALYPNVDKTFSYAPQSLEQADHPGNLIKSRPLALEQDTCPLIPGSCLTRSKSLTFLGSNCKMRGKNNTYPSYTMGLRDLHGIWLWRSLEEQEVLPQSKVWWSILTIMQLWKRDSNTSKEQILHFITEEVFFLLIKKIIISFKETSHSRPATQGAGQKLTPVGSLGAATPHPEGFPLVGHQASCPMAHLSATAQRVRDERRWP